MADELEQFQQDLLHSVRQMKAGKFARVTEVPLSAAAEARAKVGISQSGKNAVACRKPASGSIAGFAPGLR